MSDQSGLNIELFENVLTSPEDIFQDLENQVAYLPADKCKIRIQGKTYPVPREIAAYGDPDLSYSFSGLTVIAQPWTLLMRKIKTCVENITGIHYNFVLINRYRDGDSCISQHKDNESYMDEQCAISSLSLGETRTMVFKKPGCEDHTVELKSNSLLLMKPPTNSEWSHGIPRQKKRNGVRINLTFRKMKTLKRSHEEEAIHANKKPKTGKPKDSGVFTDDTIPPGVFPLGEEVFVIPATFQGEVMVHLRKYKKYEHKYYPTAEGVTLRPEWSEHIMGRTKVPESERELPVSLFTSLNEIKITSKDFQNFIFTRIKMPHKSISITCNQWYNMICRYDDITTVLLDHVFGAMDLHTQYISIAEEAIESTLPSSLDVSLGSEYLKQVLHKVLCNQMKEQGLQLPESRGEELFAHTIKTFNSAALYLNAQEIADEFYHSLWDTQHFLLMKPAMYVTKDFFNSLQLNIILNNVRKEFCPPETVEYFEDFE